MSNKVQIHRFLVVENAAIIIQLTSCDVTCIQRHGDGVYINIPRGYGNLGIVFFIPGGD